VTPRALTRRGVPQGGHLLRGERKKLGLDKKEHLLQRLRSTESTLSPIKKKTSGGANLRRGKGVEREERNIIS